MKSGISEAQKQEAEKLLLRLGEIVGVSLRLHSDVSGNRWVSECIEEFCREYGRDAVRDLSEKQLPYDLDVLGFRVQCKSRTPKAGRRMTIGKWWGKSRYEQGQFDFLALKYGDAKYVIPSLALIRADGTFKNDISPDRFWRYRDQWKICDSGHRNISDVYCPLFRTKQEAMDGR
jgi:hypothetical protein